MYPKNISIDHHLRATWQAVSKMYNDEASKHESTMAVAFVLLNIDQYKGTASTALGPKMGMKSTSLSRLLKRMEDENLIYREKNPKDGRGVLIKLTSFGKQKRTLSKKNVVRFNETVKNHLNATQIQHFFEVTEKINELIENKLIFKAL